MSLFTTAVAFPTKPETFRVRSCTTETETVSRMEVVVAAISQWRRLCQGSRWTF